MQDLIQSPLNYTGGKFRLLPQILPFFPKTVRNFVDLFCGGCSVGINACAERVIYNDRESRLTGLLRLFREKPESEIMDGVYSIIRRYGLSLTKERGYGHYGCDSSAGLAACNRGPFLALREYYNKVRDGRADPALASLMLYVLVVYAFNNQLRFNSLGEYNLPVGKRDFNQIMETKLRRFVSAIQAQNCEIMNADFRDFKIGTLDSRDLVYIDPPYLIACAAYNENGGWNKADEKDLLDFLDRLAERKIKLALSNVIEAKGKMNETLAGWLEKRNYRVHHLRGDYSNSNYHRLKKSSFTDEVLITNYGTCI